MHYISTRGFGPVNFETTVLDGLAPDGGLYVPTSYPKLSREELDELSFLSYEDMADKIMSPFIGDSIPSDVLSNIIKTAYSKFNDIEVTPVVQYEENLWLMELFHGPTFAFKDVAMQFLGPVLEYTLGQKGQTATVIGATSGDTGPAAIEGLKNSENINVFMLYPHNRTSAIQRMQMTTSGGQNIFPIAVEGTFDDCQDIVKELFSDLAFKEQVNATSVNSISWARLLPQMVDYSVQKVVPTRSPSMDIQVASNFERLLFDIYGRDADVLKHNMQEFKNNKTLPQVNALQLDEVRSIFTSHKVSEVETLKMMSESDFTHNIVIDPHTAVGLAAAKAHPELKPCVSLATAHPLKFPSALKEATAKELLFDDDLDKMMKSEEKFDILPPETDTIRQYILDNI